jgi:hypothetical protein
VIATYRDFKPVEYVVMVLGLTCGAIVLTWLYNRSGGSVLLVTVWHGVYNFVAATQAAVGAVAAVVSTRGPAQRSLLGSRDPATQRSRVRQEAPEQGGQACEGRLTGSAHPPRPPTSVDGQLATSPSYQ